jgi:hypothetical protein
MHQGVLDGAGFPAVVTAHFVPMEGQQRPRTTILIKFAEEVNLSLILLLFRGHAMHTFSTDSLFLGYLPGVT